MHMLLSLPFFLSLIVVYSGPEQFALIVEQLSGCHENVASRCWPLVRGPSAVGLFTLSPSGSDLGNQA